MVSCRCFYNSVFDSVLLQHTGSGQHGFAKGRSGMTNLIVISVEMTGSVNEDRAVDVVYLDFGKALVWPSTIHL